MTDAPDHDPVRREYARLAADYDRRWARYVEESVAATLAAFTPQPGERLLDAGCGTGVLLARLAERHPDVRAAGADLSAEMLAVARRRLGAAAALVNASAEALPFAEASLDRLVSVSAFHFFRRPRRALAEAERVLRPGGTLVLTDWCREGLAMRALDAWLRRRDPAHFHTYDRAELRALLTGTRLEAVALKGFAITWPWRLMTLVARRAAGRDAPSAT